MKILEITLLGLLAVVLTEADHHSECHKNCVHGDCAHHGDDVWRCNCKLGWKGKWCDTVALTCANVTCENNGTCKDVGGRFSCNCTIDYCGEYCQRDHPHCNEKCKNGECHDEICICNLGWKGTWCDTVAKTCANVTCKNNGTCENVRGRFSCKCTNDWFGELCQRASPCRNITCQNGGTCATDGNTTECFCNPGFNGEFCTTDIPKPNCTDRCKNGGICKIVGNKAICFCAYAWTGHYCELVSPCNGIYCDYHGSCEVFGKNFAQWRCNCKANWKGKYCEIPIDPTITHH